MRKILILIGTALISGTGMWMIAGLWHNLVLPALDSTIHPHHDGLFIMYVAYFTLGLLMVLLYMLEGSHDRPIFQAARLGAIVGILWVFPHGLAMSGIHKTLILSELKNTIWHIFEQGIGGLVIGFLLRRADNPASARSFQKRHM